VNDIAKNEGKKFEDAFIKSVPDYVLVKRLNDNASSWSGGTMTRFASKNECDYILFDDHASTFYGLELKSTKHNSLTFWREDFDNKDKKQTFQIRKCQIQGLEKWSKHKGVFGLVINFRDSDNKTYFVNIRDFLEYTAPPFTKKSISKSDVLNMNPIEIDCELLRTNYRYDVEKFLKETRCQNANFKNV
jgi:penicillin-binding protein-related factor A (putative recombinase)